jgi:hypothetical protein
LAVTVGAVLSYLSGSAADAELPALSAQLPDFETLALSGLL